MQKIKRIGRFLISIDNDTKRDVERNRTNFIHILVKTNQEQSTSGSRLVMFLLENPEEICERLQLVKQEKKVEYTVFYLIRKLLQLMTNY